MNKLNIFGLLLTFLVFSGCLDDLDQYPLAENAFTEIQVFENSQEAKSALVKLYGALALTGQEGPTGNSDLGDIIDEGESQYSRLLFNLNELTTDHIKCAWDGDASVVSIQGINWGSDNGFIQAMYYRLGQTVSFCNSFISNAKPLAEREKEVEQYVAEARFIRAYAYYNLMDLFGNVPLETEVKPVIPEQKSRLEIFQFVEQELLEISTILSEAQSNEYGRVDRVAAWALLSRLYLNAEVYTGTPRYDECLTFSEKVLNSGYRLHDNYQEIFMGDNNSNGAQNEAIFILTFDGLHSQSWGGTTFLVNSCIGNTMTPTDYGTVEGWGGNRATKNLVHQFDVTASDANKNPIAWGDDRALFFHEGHNLEIEELYTFTDGYAIPKYRNSKTNGETGNDPDGKLADTDLALIRVAEMHLNYAEATLRGAANGDNGKALSLMNELRARANASSLSALNLQTILDERSRELYMEGLRRPDLIRYGQYTSSSYVWPWKGNVPEGRSVDGHFRLFPIPTNVLFANPNMEQNPGY